MRRTSDAEITRPQNELPSEPPPLPAWHVHLELQPEELITLHRLGFTGGALAWREGMPEWQPLRIEQGLRDASKPPAAEDSLPQPIPLTRRSKSSSSSIASLDRRRNSPFNTGRHHSTPPIAMAVPRPELMLPPPPRIETRSGSELASDEATVAINEPWLKSDHSRSPISAVREQQPPSIPPLALEARPRPQRGGSRAMWLGAAALVALSASNGALVSALLWSLRHDPTPPAASAALRAGGPMSSAASGALVAAECPSPRAAVPARSTPAKSTDSGRASPVSVDQLPLLGSRSSAVERSASEPSRARSIAPTASASSSRSASSSHTASSRKSSARVVLAEDATPARRAESAAAAATTAPGPVDRRALAQAVARAASAASSCAQGPEKGRVALTFSPAGSVQAAQLEASFGEPGINSCVLRAMGRARVRPFVGEAVTVHKTLSW